MVERVHGTANIWTPGMELHEEYPVPSGPQLIEKWQRYLGEGEVVASSHVFGVYRKPETPPRAYASVDLCEVVRHTHKALRRVEESHPSGLVDVTNYGEGLSFEGNRKDIASMVQVLMNNDLVPPVDNIHEIATIMRGWRNSGVYVFANTATLPGCEVATIDFFSKELLGAFDGILFPRNHDGTDPMTKGKAARGIIEQIPPANAQIIAVKIDDGRHHLESFTKEVGSLPNSLIKTFRPANPISGNGRSVMDLHSLESFQEADVFLRKSLRGVPNRR